MPKAVHFTKEELIDRIQYIYETDIGDFKRRVILYLNRFSQNQKDLSIRETIQELKTSILCSEVASENPMEDIDSLRFDLLEQLKNF